MYVPWELNPQPFALLTQCSTTEPQEHPGNHREPQGIYSIILANHVHIVLICLLNLSNSGHTNLFTRFDLV